MVRVRDPNGTDLVFAVADAVMPRRWREPLAQMRRDLGSVLDGVSGRTASPLLRRDGEDLAFRWPDAEEIELVAEILPASLARRWAAARRDLAGVASLLGGPRPSPLIDRRARTKAARAVANGGGLGGTSTERAARTLRIADVRSETPDAVTLVVEDPSGAPLSFEPGQFFTVLVPAPSGTLRRAYSIASPRHAGSRVQLTVKRLRGGVGSAWLCDNAVVGMALRVLGPSGSFIVPPAQGGPRHLVFLAGGSGITPIASMIETLLQDEPSATLTLVYGNRRDQDVIYRERLRALAAQHGPRLRLLECLSEPGAGWTGLTGLLDAGTLGAMLPGVLAHSRKPQAFFVCGPEPMMEAARQVLRGLGVSPSAIIEEKYAQPHLRSKDGPNDTGWVAVQCGNEERIVEVPPGQSILDAALAAGLPMPFSCAMGGCGACRVKVRGGEVVMAEPNCLTSAERATGLVLTCVGRPRGRATVEVL